MIAWTALILATALWARESYEAGAWMASRKPHRKSLAERIEEATR